MPQITTNNKIIFPELSYKINGFCFEIHNGLGRYLSEKSYCDALKAIFNKNNINFLKEKGLKKIFNSEKINRNIPDFLIENKIILEIKAKRIISKEDYYQVKRYLSAGHLQLGIIVNFRQKYLSPKRILNADFLVDTSKIN